MQNSFCVVVVVGATVPVLSHQPINILAQNPISFPTNYKRSQSIKKWYSFRNVDLLTQDICQSTYRPDNGKTFHSISWIDEEEQEKNTTPFHTHTHSLDRE